MVVPSELVVFAPPSPILQHVKSVRETEILVEQLPPQGVFVYDDADLVINKFSVWWLSRAATAVARGPFFAFWACGAYLLPVEPESLGFPNWWEQIDSDRDRPWPSRLQRATRWESRSPPRTARSPAGSTTPHFHSRRTCCTAVAGRARSSRVGRTALKGGRRDNARIASGRASRRA